MLLIFLILTIILNKHNGNEEIEKNITNNNHKSEKEHYNVLFDSIKQDNYNLTSIYNNSYNTIKIKHKTNKNKLDKEICIFGVLVNDKGLQIENSMIDWLIKEYDVYCIYQKYPGKLYEYPALRFAQWLAITYNKPIILYVHTKGAYNSFKGQEEVRELWKHEFTSPRKYIYMNLLKKNLAEVCTLFKNGRKTYFNGNFISIRAFKQIDDIVFKTDRYYYEKIFENITIIRINAILKNYTTANEVWQQTTEYLKYFKNLEELEKKKINNRVFCVIIIFLISIIYIKKLRFK